jgi:O-6-methylguanine DNA methyltransferase
MTRNSYCLFDTALGTCAIAWKTDKTGGIALTSLHLPEMTAAETEERVVQKSQGKKSEDPVPGLFDIIKRIGAHLAGVPQDFGDIMVDLAEVRPFSRQVYLACRQIPAGKTLSYGELARAINRPGSSRAVGQALAKNPIPLIIPCHRVLSADGKPGGFSAPGGIGTKVRMLALEGVKLET